MAALLSSLPFAVGPKVSFWTGESGGASATSGAEWHFGVCSTAAVGAAAAAVAIGAAVQSSKKSFYRSAGGWAPSTSGNGAAGTSATSGAGSNTPFRVSSTWTACEDEGTSSRCADVSEDSSDSEAEYSLTEESDEPPGDEGRATPSAAAPAVKLWTNAQFPEGVKPLPCNWDIANLKAAQAWTCPCSDRRNCIGEERGLTVLQLYDHRKNFLTTCNSTGGRRDTMANEMRHHYSTGTCSFSRSFVVGSLNDCCAASAGLANGLSVQTFQNARTDVRKNRLSAKRAVRKRKLGEKVSHERGIIDAYIRRLRGTYEGSKGRETLCWHTGKRSIPKRWDDFKKHRAQNALPDVGSIGVFRQLWNSHTEILEQGATGHPICERCGEYEALYDRLEGRTDAAAITLRAEGDDWKEIHDIEHSGERKYAEDIWGAAELRQDKITAQNFDAPTVSQFDIPVQKRAARDVTKRLESMQKWGSKVTGVMTAGAGMLCFIARAGLGGGPNLSLTLLYLSLLHIADSRGGKLGSRYNLLMDNTGGDNKNAEMVAFIGWLVYTDVFNDASFFCQLKGHTFTVLDQSFNTLICQLLAQAIYTVSALISFIFQFLQPYGCQEVIELHQLWDWKTAFKPHNSRIEGFCTGQYGAGMHECYIRKDAEGVTRMWMRKSSRASGWLPEGPGFQVCVCVSVWCSCVCGVHVCVCGHRPAWDVRLQVFESDPEMPPPIAPTKSASTWGKPAVAATIRAWYNFMAIESGELKNVKEEWEARFAALPLDTDASSIDPGLQLQWRELPRRNSQDVAGGTRPEHQSATQRRRGSLLDGISLALENPPVNPLTGRGRTSADVARDTQAWQAYVRSQASDEFEAVFQGDYLFVHPPNQTLQLHRVASGAFIEDATAPGISFQTSEYVQTPDPLIGGFWGEFTMKPNADYNPANKKTGGIYVRHSEITRDHIKLYHVKVVIVKKAPIPDQRPATYVRVLAESLTRLAKVCPEFVVPKQLPASHADDDIASADDDIPQDDHVEEEEDPPPPIPHGYKQVPAPPRSSVTDFLLWSTVGNGRAEWHLGVVTKVYPANFTYRGKPYTHDAKLDGNEEVRGVNLTRQLEADGLWVALQSIAAPCHPPATRPRRSISGL